MDLSVFDGGSGNTYLSYKAQGEPHWKCDGESVETSLHFPSIATFKRKMARPLRVGASGTRLEPALAMP